MARRQTGDGIDRVAEARARLEAATLALIESDAYRRHLRAVAKFHRYSWGNCMLILAQREDATFVAGFHRWLDLGRCVRKGETAIRILAPRLRHRIASEDDEEVVINWVTFGTACVFDISQTDPIPGHPHPFEMPSPADAAGDAIAAANLIGRLARWLRGRGVKVQVEDDAGRTGTAGWYRHGTREIYLRPTGPMAQRLTVLIHEAAHALAHGHADGEHGRAANEVIAQSIAFVVCDAVGIDAGEFSTDYLAHWLRSDPDGFRKGQAFIADAARELIAALDAGDQDDAGDTMAA
jgi:antirestriction protein ArdC